MKVIIKNEILVLDFDYKDNYLYNFCVSRNNEAIYELQYNKQEDCYYIAYVNEYNEFAWVLLNQFIDHNKELEEIKKLMIKLIKNK